MEWIRFDEEHRPEHNQVVMVTANLDGKRLLYHRAKYSRHQKAFYITMDDFHVKWGEEIITHWMPYPKPAED